MASGGRFLPHDQLLEGVEAGGDGIEVVLHQSVPDQQLLVLPCLGDGRRAGGPANRRAAVPGLDSQPHRSLASTA
jgi:hypothetical protein